MSMAQHDPTRIPIPLELARALMAYLGTRTYNESVKLIDGLHGAVSEWEQAKERAAEPPPEEIDRE